MHDLLIPKLDGRTLRAFPIEGDAMSPTLRHGDVAMVAPCDRWLHAGLYVLDCDRFSQVFRCDAAATGGYAMILDRDGPEKFRLWSVEEFRDRCLGIVVAACRVDQSAVERLKSTDPRRNWLLRA